MEPLLDVLIKNVGGADVVILFALLTLHFKIKAIGDASATGLHEVKEALEKYNGIKGRLAAVEAILRERANPIPGLTRNK